MGEMRKGIMPMKKLLLINCSPVRNGATAEIVHMAQEGLSAAFETKAVCIDDYSIALCRGCRSCHQTAACVMQDGAQELLSEMAWADVILCVAPSYWADVPGQFKVFIDRCTPWCNTHEPYATIGSGKAGYAIALRTGPSMRECDRLLETIRHFYGHLEVDTRGTLGLCQVENRDDALGRKEEILRFCEDIASRENQ